MRRKFTTTLDEKLLTELQVYATRQQTGVNVILEELISKFLEEKQIYPKNDKERGQRLE